MSEIWGGVVTILMAIVGVAIIAVLVSQNAQTGSVITSAGNAFANDLRAATGPVTGGGALGGVGIPPLSGGAGSILNE